MNQERIKELAEQAEKLKRDEVSYRERLHNRYYTGDMEEEIFIEKFAELIVRQCIYLVDNLPPRYKDYRNQIEDSFRTDCVEKIEQYFGVEE